MNIIDAHVREKFANKIASILGMKITKISRESLPIANRDSKGISEETKFSTKKQQINNISFFKILSISD